jgi:hypothetical protein
VPNRTDFVGRTEGGLGAEVFEAFTYMPLKKKMVLTYVPLKKLLAPVCHRPKLLCPLRHSIQFSK